MIFFLFSSSGQAATYYGILIDMLSLYSNKRLMGSLYGTVNKKKTRKHDRTVKTGKRKVLF